MAKISIQDISGKAVGEVSLEPKIFDVTVKPSVIHQVVTALQSNSRPARAHAKLRSEVRGGGRKPWKQKGTGNARQGSIRAPQWKGGGVVFGPRSERNFSQKINVKMRRLALCMGLSDRARNKRISVLNALTLAQPKTKEFFAIMKNLGLQKTKTLVVLEKADAQIKQSSRNLPTVAVRTANSLNVLDVLRHQHLMFTAEALNLLKKTFSAK